MTTPREAPPARRALRTPLPATPIPRPRGILAFQDLGRVLLHAGLVGAAAGLAGSLFFAALELGERHILEGLTGYQPLRAHGEAVLPGYHRTELRPWLICLIPAIGALIGGLLTSKLAPEARGGGADALIDAFHHRGGVFRRRVPLVKALASFFTLASGGSGGREGPTMQIGGGIGSLLARALRVGPRERRILLIAGAAAGMSAMFRTPLGAALLVVEVLHRDDFESDALVPSILASVVSYSVFIYFFGESTLFTHAPRYPFIPSHLPLYALFAVLLSVIAVAYVSVLHNTERLFQRIRLPPWAKPALGGLALGLFVTPILILLGSSSGHPGQGFGLLGAGYGAAQVAISGASWLPAGWAGVELLLLLLGMKILATSLTVGSGGSAGDFGPSLVIGALAGGAFGRAAEILIQDPRIDPGAFALVGMGALYGGIAHVPIAALVMVCELAGSYDLLVPLMLCEGIAFAALRHRSLYRAQVPTRRDSPAHRDDLINDVLRGIRVGEIVVKNRPFVVFDARTKGASIVSRIAACEWQDTFPVLDEAGKVIGTIDADILRTAAMSPEISDVAIAHDMMDAPAAVADTEDLHRALQALLEHEVRELVVLDAEGRIVGFLDEADVARAYHEATTGARREPS
ncbi:chloride channel protein [Chondromyces apiculatus]|uniref:Chloride channel protein n=1 Tax=Chondromyces apiculatus DSM 436 TaxID=1192034 RepID=A0A017TD18_9BACT|nr:chloride channel protein [Chondromyces apiculatus]EYF07178.1 Chloride channel protein [Chondromyces apiculatus DSM 436]